MTKSEIHKVPVTLTPAQFRALTQGKKIRLKASQLREGQHVLHLTSRVKARKLVAAAGKQKGCECSLTPDEFRHTMEGEGFKDFMKKTGRLLKKGWKEVKPILAPVLKKGIRAGVSALSGIATTALGQPELAPVVSGLANKGADYVAHRIGAYGIHSGGKLSNPANNLEDHVDVGLFGIHNHTPDHVLMNNNSNFIPAAHPAANPTLIQNDPLARIHLGKVVSGADKPSRRRGAHPALEPVFREQENIRNTPAYIRGGSFMAAGYGFKPAGY